MDWKEICFRRMVEYFDKIPLIPREYLDAHHDGLIEAGIDEVENSTEIVDQIEYVHPIPEGRFLPKYPNADEELMTICTKNERAVWRTSGFGSDKLTETGTGCH